MGRKKHLVRLAEFKKSVERDMPVERLILFGSRAKGRPNRWSDFDLIVVSSHFRRKSFRYRGLNLYDHWNLDYPVDFLCYTPEEFNRKRKSVSLVRQAAQEGIEIK